MHERLGIAGSGAIACGLATAAAHHGPVLLWARSEDSVVRARRVVERACLKLDDVDPSHVQITTALEALGDATAVVEAVVEDAATKAALWSRLRDIAGAEALLASTTSSLSVQALAEVTGAPERFVALHVFNPVPRMRLVELAFAREATATTRSRAGALCTALGKTAVEVPDVPGFVVNRLLFPYLFSAVRLMEDRDLDPEAIDTCMELGAGHPMGPLALLDYVGLDVAKAIGEAIGATVPAGLDQLVAEGALGRKSGRGFYRYDAPGGDLLRAAETQISQRGRYG